MMKKGRQDKADYNLVRFNKEPMPKRSNMMIHGAYDSAIIQGEERYAFAEKNPLIFSLLSAFFLPYILGMLLMLFYIGVSISDFFHVYSGLSQFIFWIFGVYLIITVIDLWLLFKKLTLKSQ